MLSFAVIINVIGRPQPMPDPSELRNEDSLFALSAKGQARCDDAEQDKTSGDMTKCTSRHARPPAWAMLEAPLKMVLVTRFQSLITCCPSAYRSCSGTTVQPSRTPVKPAYLLKEQVSTQHASAPALPAMLVIIAWPAWSTSPAGPFLGWSNCGGPTSRLCKLLGLALII